VQTFAGQCPAGANYWDLGVLGQPQASPAYVLNPTYSVLTPVVNAIYTGNNNQLVDPALAHQYCNGSRANPGIPDATPPNPPFAFQPAVTEDEGGNWVDLRYGPLSLSDSSIASGTAGYGVALGDYRICGNANTPSALCTAKSPAIDVASNADGLAPNHDIFNDSRPQGPGYDEGAYEVHQNSGVLGVSPTALSFPLTRVYTYSPSEPLTVTNTGAGPLVVTSITIAGMPDGFVDFIQNSNCINVTLQPTQSCTINVTFGPYRHFLRTGTLVINSNAMNPAVSVGLSGAAYQVTYNPNALNFGTLQVGQQVSRTVTVSNWGIDPVSFAAVLSNIVPVTPTPMYTITSNTCSPAIAAVPTGTAVFPPAVYAPVICTITVRLRPIEVDPITGTLTLTWSDPNPPSPAVIPLTAISTSGIIVNPLAIVFPNVNVGAQSPIRSITVSNTTPLAVALSAPTVSGSNAGDFVLVGGSCGAILNAGNICNYSLRFRPTAAGARAATITIHDAQDPLGQSVPLSGTATAPIAALTPNTYGFGNVRRGISFALAPTFSFTLSNSGNGPLTNIQRSISGSLDFTIVGGQSTCGNNLAAGANCTITVRFRPRLADTVGVAKTATLTITDSDTTTSPQTATLSGTPQ